MAKGKIIVLSAPSGCGKSTIIRNITSGDDALPLEFSVSATNRAPRVGEIDGVHYHFLDTDTFRKAVDNGEFVEWEEVYPGRYYGTQRRQLDSALAQGRNIVMDIDVKGAINVKKLYGEDALTLFIMPPSIAELRHRLESRGTDAPDVIDTRVAKAEFEMAHAPQFDCTVVNDRLEDAVESTRRIIKNFIEGKPAANHISHN